MQHELSAKEKRIFKELPTLKAVLVLAVPTVISQIIMVIYNLADTYYVGRAADAAKVASVTICMPLMMLMTGMANLYGIGGSSIIARKLGKNDFKGAQNASAFAIWAGIFTALIYSTVLFVFSNPVLKLLGAEADTIEQARKYMLWIAVIGSVPTMLNSLMAHLIRSEGESAVASIGVSMGGIMNMILDPLFMFVILPSGMEVTGAAIATALSNTIVCIFFLTYILRKKSSTVLTFDPRKITLKDGVAQSVISVGLPSFLMTILSSASNITVNNLISASSSAAIAGMGVSKKINMLSFRVTTGITQGALPLIAFNHTSGNHKRMKQAVIYATGLSFCFAFIYMCISFTFGGSLVKLFISDPDTIAYGRQFIRTICLAMPLASISLSSMMLFQAAAKKKQATVLSVLRKGVLDIPLMFLFNGITPVFGVAFATPVAEIIGCAIAITLDIRFLRRLGKNNAQL